MSLLRRYLGTGVMKVTIDLPTEVAAAAQTQATAQGLRLEEFIRTLTEQATVLPWSQRPASQDAVLAWEEFCTPIEGLNLAPDENFSREMIYFDHD